MYDWKLFGERECSCPTPKRTEIQKLDFRFKVSVAQPIIVDLRNSQYPSYLEDSKKRKNRVELRSNLGREPVIYSLLWDRPKGNFDNNNTLLVRSKEI